MTQEQAQQQADNFNTELAENVAKVKYFTMQYWTPTLLKTWTAIIIPAKYEAQYNAADISQKIAFQRVTIQAFSSFTDTTAFINAFDTLGAQDEELAAYLNL